MGTFGHFHFCRFSREERIFAAIRGPTALAASDPIDDVFLGQRSVLSAETSSAEWAKWQGIDHMYRINSFIKEAQRLYPLQCVSPCRSLDALRYLIPSRVSRRLSPRDKYLTLTWHQLPYLLLGLTTVACDSLRCEQHAICNNDREAELR